MTATPFKPFGGDQEVSIGDLLIQTEPTLITISGAIEIAKDRTSLASLRALQSIINACVTELETQELPEIAKATIDRDAVQIKPNPFS